MADSIATIRQRLELAQYLPEQFGSGYSAAARWREDVTTLLAEIERLKARLATRREELSAEKGHVTMYRDEHVKLAKQNERLRAALEGVLAEADRKTDAFDRAHAALNQTPFTQDEVDAAVKALDTLPWQT